MNAMGKILTMSAACGGMLDWGDMMVSMAGIKRMTAEKEAELERQRAHGEHYKPCRKVCRMFKCNRCWEKSYAEQRECYDGRVCELDLEGQQRAYSCFSKDVANKIIEENFKRKGGK